MLSPSNLGDVSVILVAIVGGAIALGLAIALIAIAVKVTGGILSAIGWLIKHIVKVVVGIFGDAIKLVGSLIAAIVALPFVVFNTVLFRWSSAARWGGAVKREFLNVGYRSYSLVLKRPLQLLCLDGILEGVERRLPQEDAGLAPSGEVPAAEAVAERRGRSGSLDPAEFEGYSIEGTLRPGGSGAKLYIARPDEELRRRLAIHSDRVVIKSFALEEGSSLPQIVRESRALDSARALGLVFDHGLDNGRFWYAMPYHPGESLGETTRFLHAKAGSEGLHSEPLGEAITYIRDLVATLTRYHEGGLWHKDVKPENIIVHDGRAHLVDLGLVTPLRSAMTLTTHGTEYFRDPEMVRQALRGVRVHQVDGAKFDVYGAGAVLYFLLENTFPAHGGLSSFVKRSPEALRWVVRRSMADYHQRYHSAKAMLDDLTAIAQSADPWTMKPIELPSMRSADLNAVNAFGAAPAAAAVAAAAVAGPWNAPAQPAVHPAGWQQGGPWGATPVGAGSAAAIPSHAGRPRLVVTNWWSGAYASPDVAERVRSARTEMAEVSFAARIALNASKGGDGRAPRPRRVRQSPPRLAAMIGLMVPVVVVAFVALMAVRGRVPAVLETPADVALSSALAPKRLAAPAAGTPLVVVNDHPAVANPEVAAMIDAVVASYEARGFRVVRDDQDTAAKLSLALAKQRATLDGDLDGGTEIEASLATGGYWGGLHIRAAEGVGTPVERFEATPLGQKLTAAITEASNAGSKNTGAKSVGAKNVGSKNAGAKSQSKSRSQQRSTPPSSSAAEAERSASTGSETSTEHSAGGVDVPPPSPPTAPPAIEPPIAPIKPVTPTGSSFEGASAGERRSGSLADRVTMELVSATLVDHTRARPWQRTSTLTPVLSGPSSTQAASFVN